MLMRLWQGLSGCAQRASVSSCALVSLQTECPLLDKRRGESVTSKKLPENLRARTILFSEIADDATRYVEKHYARPCDDVSRLKLLKERLPGAADAITPGHIENMLDALTEEKT